MGTQVAEGSAWGPCPDPVSQGRSAQTQEELLCLGQGRGPPRRGQDVRVCFPIRMWESIPQRLQDTGSHPTLPPPPHIHALLFKSRLVLWATEPSLYVLESILPSEELTVCQPHLLLRASPGATSMTMHFMKMLGSQLLAVSLLRKLPDPEGPAYLLKVIEMRPLPLESEQTTCCAQQGLPPYLPLPFCN